MYIIIGGDQKEYGPISADDMRQWIAEGRLSEQSLVKLEGAAEFRPLGTIAEFGDAFMSGGSIPSRSSAFAGSGFANWEERDYELDIGGCVSRGWNLLKNNFGTLFVCFLVMIGLEMACVGMLNLLAAGFAKSLLHAPMAFRLGYNYIISAAISLLMGPLMGGLFLVYLKKIRQQQTSVGEIFLGFTGAYLHLFLGALMVSLITGLCMLPFNVVWQMKAGPVLDQLQNLQGDPTALQHVLPQLTAAFTRSLPFFLVCLIPVTYLTVCWQFTLPLIIDKQMKFGTAMKASFKMVNKHWWQVFGMTLVAGLVSVSGILACCLGILVTIPIGIAAMMFAYETIFSERQAA